MLVPHLVIYVNSQPMEKSAQNMFYYEPNLLLLCTEAKSM